MGEININTGGYEDIPYDVDFGLLTGVVEAIRYIASYLMGLVGVFIIIYMTIITVIDIAYITIPAFQDTCRDRNWDGSQDMEKVRFKLISRDAYNAVEKAVIKRRDGKYGNTILIYIGSRIRMYFIGGIVLSVMVLGTEPFMNVIRNLFEPLLKGLGIY